MRHARLAAGTVLFSVALVGCFETRLCPETWGEPDGRCEAPALVVEAAESHLSTGIYGYVISYEPSGCGECELELGVYASFGLQRTSEDGTTETIEIRSGRDATFEVELPPGVYSSTEELSTNDRALLQDEEGFAYFVLEEGDVVFLRLSLACAVRC